MAASKRGKKQAKVAAKAPGERPAFAGERAPAAKPARSPRLRTEGQRLLLEVQAPFSVIAKAVGCSSKATVADWRTGEKSPGPEYREKLFEAFGIPREAWAKAPVGVSVPPPSRAPSQPPEAMRPNALPSTKQGCLDLLASVREARGEAGILPGERVKLADTEARVLALRHRLEKDEELLEDRVVREHPMWRRIRAVIIKALAKHPIAARDVEAALLTLDHSPGG